jgi:hypothetical protein
MRNGPYILRVAPENYPGKRYRGTYAYEHHLVWWQAHGVVPGPDEVIHHQNGDKHDNRIENLGLLTRKAHAEHHGEENRVLETATCAFCGAEFSALPSRLAARRKQNDGRLFCSRLCGAKAQHRRKPKLESDLTHGTSAGYLRRRCRCALCREWNNARMRVYKAKKRSKEPTVGW